MKRHSLLLGCLLGWHAHALAGDPGQIAVSTELKASATASSNTLATLAPGAAIQVEERSGPWYRVSTAQGQGWVRMLTVRLASGSRGAGASTGSGLAALGEASRTSTTVATGIRGLSREDLQKARENPQEVARLDRYAVSADEARQFGQSAELPLPRH